MDGWILEWVYGLSAAIRNVNISHVVFDKLHKRYKQKKTLFVFDERLFNSEFKVFSNQR